MASEKPNRAVAIIPSRLQSERLPCKPLVDIHGLPLIVHVYKRASLSNVVEDVWVATDSQEIVDVVLEAGGKAILTSDRHCNGTERLAEASKHVECSYVVLVNGDEALLNPDYIELSLNTLINSDAEASILVNKFQKSGSPADFKVVLNLKSELMYISRGDIPCSARAPVEYRLKAYHIMSFRKDFLSTYATLKKSPLERIEDHEHLRMLENGYKIKAALVKSEAVSVDTYEDLEFVRSQMLSDTFFQRYR